MASHSKSKQLTKRLTTEILLPRLRPDQWTIATHPAKTKMICMGRRWGKTVMSGAIAIAAAKDGARVAWIAPTYKNSRPLWRWAEAAVSPTIPAGVQIARTDRVISFPSSGSISIYTADAPDAIRGESFHVVIEDEAARISEEAHADAIQPTLADHDGDLLCISTPKGRNWFWREWERGRDSNDSRDSRESIASFQAPSSDNPNANIRAAFHRARATVSERTFKQEWLAQFVEGGGTVFRSLREVSTATAQSHALEDHSYVFGVDWARTTDFTVITCVDSTTKELVAMDRFTGIGYELQLTRLRAMYERFKPYAIVAESNAMGGPLIEQLNKTEMPVKAFNTTNASKDDAINALALAFERRDLRILNHPALIAELEAYELETLPSGAIRYGAPDGMHDDCVMSLALAWTRARRVQMMVG